MGSSTTVQCQRKENNKREHNKRGGRCGLLLTSEKHVKDDTKQHSHEQKNTKVGQEKKWETVQRNLWELQSRTHEEIVSEKRPKALTRGSSAWEKLQRWMQLGGSLLKGKLPPFVCLETLQATVGTYTSTTIKAENYLSHMIFLSSQARKCSCHPRGHRYHHSDRYMSGGSWGHIVPGDTLQRINKVWKKYIN